MKKIVFQLVILAALALISCNKHTADILVTPSAGRNIDTALVRLTRVDIANLPSPYYRFTYNDSGYATTIHFASGFFQYELQYGNKRLKRMTNIVNGDFLAYTYRDGNVTDVDEYMGSNGERFGHYDLAYDASHRLTTLEYARFDNNGDSIAERRFNFNYHSSGNLAWYKSYWRDNAGQLAWVSTTSFDDYDNGMNVDDFGLYKEFFEHFLYLPAVKLLKNNPRSSHVIGVNNDYEITYSFSYNNKLPLTKTTTMRQTRGSEAGQVRVGRTEYTY
jgi:hypothetical protein